MSIVSLVKKLSSPGLREVWAEGSYFFGFLLGVPYSFVSEQQETLLGSTISLSVFVCATLSIKTIVVNSWLTLAFHYSRPLLSTADRHSHFITMPLDPPIRVENLGRELKAIRTKLPCLKKRWSWVDRCT